MDSTLLSVILPTYNVEKYLRQCLESIRNQTYSHFEAIIVVDGATDGSYAIAKAFAESDARFQVVWQENSGSGPARNNGLKHAKGEVVMFIDPDDWIEEDLFEGFIAKYLEKKPDLIICGYVEDYASGGTTRRTVKSLQEKEIFGTRAVREEYLPLYFEEAVSAPTRKLYKKEIIDQYAVEFPDLRRSQDIVFNYRYYKWISSVAVLPQAPYHYRVDESAYLLKLKKGYDKTISLLFREILDMHKSWGLEIPDAQMMRLLNRFLTLVGYYIESCIMQSVDFDSILDDDTICCIVEKANPIDKYHACLRYFLYHRNMMAVEMAVKAKIFVKKNMKPLFLTLRKIKKY